MHGSGLVSSTILIATWDHALDSNDILGPRLEQRRCRILDMRSQKCADFAEKLVG
jgi:hypothetical protein